MSAFTRFRIVSTFLISLSFSMSLAAAGKETLAQMILRVTGITAAPTLRGVSPNEVGNVWVAGVDGAAPVPWTQAGGLRSPVFDLQGRTIYAMQQDSLVRIDSPQSLPTVVRTAPGIDKLVGFDPQSPDALLALTSDPAAPLALLPLGRGLQVSMPVAPDDAVQQRVLAKIRGQDRVAGRLQVQVVKKDRQELTGIVEWTDIVVQFGSEAPRNISNCNGAFCSQPALTADLSRVAYVKTTR